MTMTRVWAYPNLNPRSPPRTIIKIKKEVLPLRPSTAHRRRLGSASVDTSIHTHRMSITIAIPVSAHNLQKAVVGTETPLPSRLRQRGTITITTTRASNHRRRQWSLPRSNRNLLRHTPLPLFLHLRPPPLKNGTVGSCPPKSSPPPSSSCSSSGPTPPTH